MFSEHHGVVDDLGPLEMGVPTAVDVDPPPLGQLVPTTHCPTVILDIAQLFLVRRAGRGGYERVIYITFFV